MEVKVSSYTLRRVKFWSMYVLKCFPVVLFCNACDLPAILRSKKKKKVLLFRVNLHFSLTLTFTSISTGKETRVERKPVRKGDGVKIRVKRRTTSVVYHDRFETIGGVYFCMLFAAFRMNVFGMDARSSVVVAGLVERRRYKSGAR